MRYDKKFQNTRTHAETYNKYYLQNFFNRCKVPFKTNQQFPIKASKESVKALRCTITIQLVPLVLVNTYCLATTHTLSQTELHQIQGSVKSSPNKKLHHQSSCNKTIRRCQTV